MRKKKLLLMLNLASSKTTPQQIGNIIENLIQSEYLVTVNQLPLQDELIALMPKIVNIYDVLVVSGGDGSINYCFNAMLKIPAAKRIPIGIIPTGTTCDYARSLGIELNSALAAQQIVKAQPQLVDVGNFADQNFVYVAACGSFSSVAYTTTPDAKKKLGHLAYILEGLKELSNLPSYPMKITVDGITFQGNFLFAAVTNTLSIGGLINLSNANVNMADGEFEMILIKDPALPFIRQAALASMIFSTTSNANNLFIKGKSFSFESKIEIPWTIDGEYGGSFNHIDISVNPRCLEILVP